MNQKLTNNNISLLYIQIYSIFCIFKKKSSCFTFLLYPFFEFLYLFYTHTRNIIGCIFYKSLSDFLLDSNHYYATPSRRLTPFPKSDSLIDWLTNIPFFSCIACFMINYKCISHWLSLCADMVTL